MTACGCLRCVRIRGNMITIGPMKIPEETTRMILCEICGNKRCPHASDHRYECTNSNAPGQAGSVYEGERHERT